MEMKSSEKDQQVETLTSKPNDVSKILGCSRNVPGQN